MRKILVLCIMLALTVSLTSACPIQDAKNTAAKLAAEEAAKDQISPDISVTIPDCADGNCTTTDTCTSVINDTGLIENDTCSDGNCTAQLPVDNGTVKPDCPCKCCCGETGCCNCNCCCCDNCSCCSGCAMCQMVTPIVDPVVSPIDCTIPTCEEVTPVEDVTGCSTCGGNV